MLNKVLAPPESDLAEYVKTGAIRNPDWRERRIDFQPYPFPSYTEELDVSLDRHDSKFVSEFVSKVTKRRKVLDCFATTGDADYHLRVVVRDMNAYNRFLDEFMFRIAGVRHVRSNIVLKEIKTDVALPF